MRWHTIQRVVGPRGLRIRAVRAAGDLAWPLRRRRFRAHWRAQARRVRWVFVLGCNNSGTSILYDALASHPDIGRLPLEGHRLTRALPHPDRHGCSRVWTERPDVFHLTEASGFDAAPRLVHDWTTWLPGSGVRFMMEKSPPDTIRARWLQAVFGDCWFIGIVRNGYAVSEGIRRRNGYPLERCARHWAVANETMLADAEQLTHFRQVHYEDLVADPAGTAGEIARWLGLDTAVFSELGAREFRTHHRDSTPGRIADFNASVLTRLTQADRAAIEGEAGPTLARLGYLSSAPATADAGSR